MPVIATKDIALTKRQILDLTEADIVCAYSGKPGCACGCLGTYYYNPEHVEYGAKRRGYAISTDEVDMTNLRRVLTEIQSRAADLPDLPHDLHKTAFDARRREWCIGEYFASVEPSSVRVYTLYIKEPVGYVAPWDKPVEELK